MAYNKRKQAKKKKNRISKSIDKMNKNKILTWVVIDGDQENLIYESKKDQARDIPSDGSGRYRPSDRVAGRRKGRGWGHRRARGDDRRRGSRGRRQNPPSSSSAVEFVISSASESKTRTHDCRKKNARVLHLARSLSLSPSRSRNVGAVFDLDAKKRDERFRPFYRWERGKFLLDI